MKRAMTAVIPRSFAAKFVVAALVMAVVIVGGNSVGEVFASGVRIANQTGSAVTISDNQYNIGTCVVSIKKIDIKSSSNEIKSVEVETSKNNSCTGADLQVVVEDSRGALSTGTLADLPKNKDKFKVDVTGKASKDRNPKAYVNIYG